MKLDRDICAAALASARERLLAELNNDGFFEGHLAGSALSTAVATFALTLAGHRDQARRGAKWLTTHINEDGGWGDTPDSPSNLAATLLAWVAVSSVDGPGSDEALKAEARLRRLIGGVDPAEIARAVLDFYGNDRTFSAPILTMCAVGGKLGDQSDMWTHVPQLPFELAVVPHRFFRWLRLSVVSYALPALIAVGLVRHRHFASKAAASLVDYLAVRQRRRTSVPRSFSSS